MPDIRISRDDITVKLELTELGKRLLEQGKIPPQVVPLTPELIAKRKKSYEDCKAASKKLKDARRKTRKKRPLPPMTKAEKKRTDLLKMRAAAHAKAAEETQEDHNQAAAETLEEHGRNGEEASTGPATQPAVVSDDEVEIAIDGDDS